MFLLHLARHTLALSFAAALALTLSADGPAAAALPALYVNFTAAHTFAVTLVDGSSVGTTSGPATTIPAGTYQLFLNDTSGSVMQFDLSGPGVFFVTNMTDAEDLSASVPETFEPSSTYTYRDDFAPGGPVWTFDTSSTVLPATATTPSTSTPSGQGVSSADVVGSAKKVVPFRGTVVGAVSQSGKTTLDRKGHVVTSLRAGRYDVTVADGSSTAGFILQELHAQPHALTSAAFVGKRSVMFELTPGRWFFYGSNSAKKTSFVVPG